MLHIQDTVGDVVEFLCGRSSNTRLGGLLRVDRVFRALSVRGRLFAVNSQSIGVGVRGRMLTRRGGSG